MRRFIIVSVAALIVLAACKQPGGGSGEGTPAATTWTVKYEVTGTATSVYITYSDLTAINNTVRTAPPWSEQFTASAGQWVYLQADSTASAFGSMTLNVYKDGALWGTYTLAAPGIAFVDEGFLE